LRASDANVNLARCCFTRFFRTLSATCSRTRHILIESRARLALFVVCGFLKMTTRTVASVHGSGQVNYRALTALKGAPGSRRVRRAQRSGSVAAQDRANLIGPRPRDPPEWSRGRPLRSGSIILRTTLGSELDFHVGQSLAQMGDLGLALFALVEFLRQAQFVIAIHPNLYRRVLRREARVRAAFLAAFERSFLLRLDAAARA
jgi:hypothetical protein